MAKRRPDSDIKFFFEGVPNRFRRKKAIKESIDRLFKSEKQPFESLNYIFCDDKFILKINKKYLKHRFRTDVITFNLSEKSDLVEGEIYISIPTVKKNSRFYNVPFSHELQRVMVHGALHLCGYEDETDSDRKTMKAKEDHYLAKFFK